MKKLFFILILFPTILSAQTLSPDVKANIGNYLNDIAKKEIVVGKIKIDSVSLNKKELQLFANENASYIPFREENVKMIYDHIQTMLPSDYQKYKLKIFANKKPIEDLIPLSLRSKKDKKAKTFKIETKNPLVTNVSSLNKPTEGLQNHHIALWQSHGFYFEQKLNRWEWQRARIFQTVEDLYTQSYVLPFLVPMLENAGANVLLPRERDWQKEEVIVDNDGLQDNLSSYEEKNGAKSWENGEKSGFAHLKKQYIDFENPFKDGTFRQIETIKKGNESVVEWIPFFAKSGEYAVYVSYQTVENSAEDALYTVFHQGGISQFKINQKMGGGTWIYLGKFKFNAGKNISQKVVLSNISSKAGKIVSADGIKFGGGMGNIARKPSGEVTENIRSSDTVKIAPVKQLPKINYPYQKSGYPRFTEAARYWLQWAGIPDSIYSDSKGKNDYTDDYKSRGKWVNFLAGGSVSNPHEKGLSIPVDLSFAFHSDAGTTMNDSIIGTLGIYNTYSDNGLYANGISRNFSRDLTDLVQSNIVNDIRALYEPKWSRRGMWDKGYFEAKTPKVPAMLLELLSHQNFADMRYGLDPRFRFTVSRAVYKGILQFIASQNKTDYVVQPLPVNNMSLKFTQENEVELSWKPVKDSLEFTATPENYIVYKRIGNGDFDNGTLVNLTTYKTLIPSGIVCSFKVTAVNKGGESFPSEILSAGKSFNEKGVVLIINGFDRISAPADFVAIHDSIGGFLDDLDHGVPYIQDISYIGKMKEFRRKIPWMDDDASGFGDSYGNYETQVIAGNTFDYPKVHGDAVLKAGYSFVSCSDEAIENKTVNLNDYKTVDLILGKECQTKMGRGGVKPLEFKTFSSAMQTAITDFCNRGGNIFVSGAYVGTDLWDNRLTKPLEEDKKFATEVLKYKWRTGQAAITGDVKAVTSLFPMFAGDFQYYNKLNAESYVVESPDAIEPAEDNAYTIFRYSENNLSAGVAYKGNYRTCVLGFPFESVKTTEEREELMKSVLEFLAP
ncbi:conserved exported hypothetical protein [uncultured Paludibacter sp.]|uniref:Golvesin/Xly CBD-like domain-containing protein n=1 Tax=uncultured Paludibacter sp. TaxID=497635 RepID=A0A653AI37_9BACT|nr:conserved exported hypothetical protein [uncultured Paludibacter sp.]